MLHGAHGEDYTGFDPVEEAGRLVINHRTVIFSRPAERIVASN